MGLILDGYRVERLIRSAGAGQVWAATREHDQLPVVAKSFHIEGSADLEARVEHEFGLIRSLDCAGVVRALALEHSGRELVLVLEAYQGVNLHEYANGHALPVDTFLAIAEQIAAILAEVHQRRVLHRDLKPTNILIEPESGAVALADFGISVLLDSERGNIHDPSVIEGTLPYMAPEQTGRTGREVDFRSDLYSLGVTFYELATGRLPFVTQSPLELIHAHFARRPPPPQRLRPELPSALSELIMKLLEKAPERRYQSARGLHADLRKLRAELRGGGTIEGFVLGSDDASTTLQLPHHLYGRELERDQLQAAFRRAAAGTPELVVVAGPSGIGKSALLDEVVEQVIARRGFLARGKFDSESARPFSAIVTATTSVIDQLLTESPGSLARWRERLSQTLGGFAPVICELVPRLTAVLGEVGAGPELSPLEARNQVMLAFVRLITELARPEHPLVLALDDLQWVDGASIALLDALLADGAAALLVLATARDEGLEHGAGLAELILKLRSRELEPLVIQLKPLDQGQLTAMIADVLSQSPEAVAPLAQIVARKTGSNPFFARQFLLLLAELGLLERKPEGWRWDVRALERATLPEDALEMMTAKLGRLDQEQRELICVASVFGSSFDPVVVERVAQGPSAMAGFQRLIEEGLLSPIAGQGLLFAHDRIREAAYALLGSERRRALHLAVGQALLERHGHGGPKLGQDAQVFEIADHLDRGYGLVDAELSEDAREHEQAALSALDDQRTEQLARINLRAGQRALSSGAAKAACDYLGLAARLLARLEPFPGRRQPRRALHFEVHIGLGEAAALIEDFERAETISTELRAHELSPTELGRATVARCWQLIVARRRLEAVTYGLEVLRTLGLALPRQIRMVHVIAALPRMTRLAKRVNAKGLPEREPIDDARVLAMIDVIMALNLVSYVISPEAFVVLVDRHAALIAEHGDHPSAPLAMSQAGLIWANALGRRTEAVALTQRCLALTQSRGTNLMSYRVRSVALFAELWTGNFLELSAMQIEVEEGALEAGDLEAANSAWLSRIDLSLYGGAHLRTVEDLTKTLHRWSNQWGIANINELGPAHERACTQLMTGPAPAPDDPSLSQRPPEADSLSDVAAYSERVQHCFVLAIFGHWRALLPIIEKFGPMLERTVPGIWSSMWIHVLIGVASAEIAGAEDTPGAERRRLRRQLRRSQRTLAKRVAGGGNFIHGELLLRAELTALRGDFCEANRLFAEAGANANEQRNPILDALASERAATYTLRQGLERHALTPLRDARANYLRWGAFAKVAALDARWPELATPSESLTPGERETSSRSSSSSTTSKALDSATMLEASQVIAEDIRLHEVIARVLRLAVENAGASRGVLMLSTDGHLSLAAEHGAEDEHATLLARPLPLAEVGDRVPAQLLRWVARTAEPVVLGELGSEKRFASDPYLAGADARSILCTPIVKHGVLIGLLYLENQLSADAFTEQRLETLRLLAAQAGSALDNARLYDDLRRSEVRWRSLVEQLPDHVALVHRNGEVTLVSAGLGPDRHSFVIEDHADELDGPLQQVFATGEQRELELSTAPSEPDPEPSEDVELSHFVVRIAPIVLDGTIERAIVVATDVSQRKRAEVERAQLEAQLRQQQRLESIGTLASGVAHEINNPVQGIMNYAELIASSPAADEGIQEFAGEIQHESKRVATIVRNLLAFSRHEQKQGESMRRTSASEIVEGTLSLIRAVLRKDQIELQVSFEDDLPVVLCRSQEIQQVVMNLVTNARDALNTRSPCCGGSKRIDVRAEAVVRDDARWLRLSVEDRGGGVPERLVSRIFDPFFTTKGRDLGTGLGLAVSHGIVADHHGELRLDNRPGVGACFSIELPGA